MSFICGIITSVCSTGNKTTRSFDFRRIPQKNHKLGQRCKKSVFEKVWKLNPLLPKTSKSIGFYFCFKRRYHFDWNFFNFYSYQTKTILHFHVVDYLWLLFLQTRRYPGTFRVPTSYFLCWEWANVLKGNRGACLRPQAESHWVWPEIKMCRTSSYPTSPYKTVIEDFEIKI